MLRSPLVRSLIRIALEEDLALGDITVDLCIPEDLHGVAKIVARQTLVVCGLELIPLICAERGIAVDVTFRKQDGERVEDQEVLAELSGPSGELLSLERTILNFLQRMSGVATQAREYHERAGSLTILDTRKTLPGWRVLDKYAVAVGGCRNHRFGLGDMVLLKNNHIDAFPGATRAERLRAAMTQVNANKPLYLPVEIEVRDQEELEAALEFQPTAVLLDNMSPADLKKAIEFTRQRAPRVLLEISGGVRLDRLEALAKLGADSASVGALTTDAPNVDISMRLKYSEV